MEAAILVILLILITLKLYRDYKFKKSVENGFVAFDKRFKAHHKQIKLLEKEIKKVREEATAEFEVQRKEDARLNDRLRSKVN